MFKDLLNTYRVVLASGSPRRQQLLQDMGVSFELRVKSVEESYPEHLSGEEIASFLARKKAQALLEDLKEDELLITADTVVWHRGRSLEKPQHAKEAKEMLHALSGDTHQVITAVCLTTKKWEHIICDQTTVTFAKLTAEEIDHYIENFKPFDKAGAYGIQEWLGIIGIEEINGSYTNVVGLPTQKLYKALNDILGKTMA